MKTEDIVNIVLRYIDEHLEEPITISILADMAGYSEYHFVRLFKSQIGMTAMEYVCRRRLIKASEDIVLGAKIIDVAIKYGWQSHSGFTKAFIKEFGFCPSLLRAMKISMDNLGGNAMSHVFLNATKIGATKEELLETLKASLIENGIYVEQNTLDKVYRTACLTYKNVKRYSGEEYVTHLINVAIILAELGAEEDIILAGMFCDVAKKGTISVNELKNHLPEEVYSIVLKVQNADTIDTAVVTVEDDVLHIKLAERLHNMRTVNFIDESKKGEKAKETIECFMPLARKLGNKKLINELNDLGIKYYIG